MPVLPHRVPKTEAEADKNTMKRAKANDPVALRELGRLLCNDGDYDGAFESLTKAAELGDADAHDLLSIFYFGQRPVQKDMKKAIYNAEQAAIGGHPIARYNLGAIEWNNGRIERAVKHFVIDGNNGKIERAIKHWIIAANLGQDDAIEVLRGEYARGTISKENFAAALRAHQAAVDATKSPQREAAEEYYQVGEKIRAEDR
jgi:TPR repeat protein